MKKSKFLKLYLKKILNEFPCCGNKIVKHQMQNLDDSAIKLILVEDKNLKLAQQFKWIL